MANVNLPIAEKMHKTHAEADEQLSTKAHRALRLIVLIKVVLIVALMLLVQWLN